MSNAEKLLCELIALRSVNPAFLSAGHKDAGELRVANFLANAGKKMGLDCELQNALPDRPNVIIRLLPKNKIKQRILLAPHLDTVPAADEKQFSPEKKNRRIYGRGACDTKGSGAAMFSALVRLSHAKSRPTETEIIFAGLVDEESGQGGSKALVANGIKANLAIVGEPTELKIVTAHKGSIWLRFETKGKSAHGARPELGKNAVHEMAQIVHLLETKYAAQLKKRRHPLLGYATISVGTIRGGTQPNIVPDSCVLTADRRTLPGEKEEKIRREISALLQQYRLKSALGKTKTVAGLPMETDLNIPLVRQFFHVANQTEAEGVDYFCDAAVLSSGGIPSVVFGPGNIAQAHTNDEWISLRSLNDANEMLFKFLQSLP